MLGHCQHKQFIINSVVYMAKYKHQVYSLIAIFAHSGLDAAMLTMGCWLLGMHM